MIQIFLADGRDQPKVVQEGLADLKRPIIGGLARHEMPEGSSCDLICPDKSKKVIYKDNKKKSRTHQSDFIFTGRLESRNPVLLKQSVQKQFLA